MHSNAKKDLLWFKKCCTNKTLVNKLKKIKFIICDVDGTLTDGSIYTTAEAEGGRNFSVLDGYMVKSALQNGLHIALVSGKSNGSTLQRGLRLGIEQDLCLGGAKDKVGIAHALQEKLSVSPQQTIIFGDDLIDAQVKKKKAAILYICPQNTPFYLQHFADLVIPALGGSGAFRLLIDLILFLQEKHCAQEFIKKSLNPK